MIVDCCAFVLLCRIEMEHAHWKGGDIMRRLSKTLQARRPEVEVVLLPSRESGLQAYAGCACGNCGCHQEGSNYNNDAQMTQDYSAVLAVLKSS
jgi:hypothetical protein